MSSQTTTPAKPTTCHICHITFPSKKKNASITKCLILNLIQSLLPGCVQLDAILFRSHPFSLAAQAYPPGKSTGNTKNRHTRPSPNHPPVMRFRPLHRPLQPVITCLPQFPVISWLRTTIRCTTQTTFTRLSETSATNVLFVSVNKRAQPLQRTPPRIVWWTRRRLGWLLEILGLPTQQAFASFVLFPKSVLFFFFFFFSKKKNLFLMTFRFRAFTDTFLATVHITGPSNLFYSCFLKIMESNSTIVPSFRNVFLDLTVRKTCLHWKFGCWNQTFPQSCMDRFPIIFPFFSGLQENVTSFSNILWYHMYL